MDPPEDRGGAGCSQRRMDLHRNGGWKNQSEGALDGRNPSRGGMDALIAQLAESFHWKPRMSTNAITPNYWDKVVPV